MSTEELPIAVLDDEIMRANVRAWRVHSQRSIWAVVKSDGYGWGLRAMIARLDADVDGYCVANYAEFAAARTATVKPIIVLGQLGAEEAVAVARGGGHPNITSLTALQAVIAAAQADGHRYPVRIGIAPALGWFGITPSEVNAYARLTASPDIALELWAHLINPTTDAAALRDFSALCAHFAQAGATIATQDLTHSRAAATNIPGGTRVRLGSGLFGVHSAEVPAVRNALRVRAPWLATFVADGRMVAGVRRVAIKAGQRGLVLGIGYGDGLPRGLVGAQLQIGTVVNVGMQYTIITCDADYAPPADQSTDSSANATPEVSGERQYVTLFSSDDDLGEITARAQCSAHEIICGLGYSARRQLQMP